MNRAKIDHETQNRYDPELINWYIWSISACLWYKPKGLHPNWSNVRAPNDWENFVEEESWS